MEHLQEVATLLRKQLGEIEAKIAELAPKPVPTRHTFDLKSEVLGISKTKKWKEFINTGVVDNITEILDECYSSFYDFINSELPAKKAVDIIGDFGSETWEKFQLNVIKQLIGPTKMSEDFSDTANGCDEITWDAGLDVIQAAE